MRLCLESKLKRGAMHMKTKEHVTSIMLVIKVCYRHNYKNGNLKRHFAAISQIARGDITYKNI